MSLLYNVTALSSPLSLGGVGGSCRVTHSGYLFCLPNTNSTNLAYYAPTIPVNLFSLGHLQRCRATYSPDPLRPLTHFTVRMSSGGPILAHAALTPNNLLPVDYESLHTAVTKFPQHYHAPLALSSTFSIPHINAEQRARADAAEQLHIDLCHPSDRSLSLNLSTGKLPFCTLTSADVTLNRSLRGPCPHCTAGKHRNPPHPPSTTSPASSVGEVISMDPQLLPETSPGQHTHEIILVDEFTGHLSIFGAKSKSTRAMFQAIQHTIATTYNANQHRVATIHGDCEKINTSLAGPLGSLGIRLQTSPPGEHAARVERYILTLRQLSLATLSTLPYILPPKYTLYLHKAIAFIRNSLINSRSSPSTPNELVHGTKPKYRIFPFGACCMVTQHIDKRLALSHAHNTSVSLEAKAEIGVCMGHDHVTGRTLFVLANGAIVPRRPTSQLPPTYTPFNWTPKTFTIASNLPLPTTSQSLPQPAPNSVVQLPHTPHTHAINLIMDHIPEAHGSPSPNLLLRSAQHNIIPLVTTLHSHATNPQTITGDPLQIQPTIPSITPNASIPPGNSSPPLPFPPITPGPQQPNPVPLSPDPSPPIPDTIPPTPVAAIIPSPDITPSTRPTRSRLPPGIWKGACLAVRTTAVHRKIHLAKQAAIRNRNHRLNNPTTLNNRATLIQPQPLQNQQAEMSIRRATSIFPASDISSGISKELGKHFVTYKSLKLIPRSAIEKKAVFLRSQIFLKKKSNGLITARLAIDGSKQPRSTYNDTYAGTSDTTNRAFILQAYLADAAHRNCLDNLLIGDFDFPGAFLHNPLTRAMTNGQD